MLDDTIKMQCGFCGGKCEFKGQIAEDLNEYRCQGCSKTFQVIEPQDGGLPPYDLSW